MIIVHAANEDAGTDWYVRIYYSSGDTPLFYCQFEDILVIATAIDGSDAVGCESNSDVNNDKVMPVRTSEYSKWYVSGVTLWMLTTSDQYLLAFDILVSASIIADVTAIAQVKNTVMFVFY